MWTILSPNNANGTPMDQNVEDVNTRVAHTVRVAIEKWFKGNGYTQNVVGVWFTQDGVIKISSDVVDNRTIMQVRNFDLGKFMMKDFMAHVKNSCPYVNFQNPVEIARMSRRKTMRFNDWKIGISKISV